MGGSWSSVFALNNDAEDLDATVDESGTVAQEQSYTAYDQQIVSTNAGAWSLNLNRGGYQDTETSFINTGGSGYVNPALANFSTPSNSGFLGGNPTAMSPPEEEPGAELNLGPDLTWGSYGGRTQGLNRLARGMESGLTFLSGFNPIYVAGGAIIGQDAGGRKLSKGQRVFMGATLAAGPIAKGAGSAIGGIKGVATGLAAEAFSSLRGMPSGLGRAARELEANGSTIVKTREQAGELFYRLFGNQGYRNATGFDGVGTKQYFGSKAMTYHWDELLDAAGNLAGHGPNNSDGLYRHLQIHLPDERVLHIFFGPKIGG